MALFLLFSVIGGFGWFWMGNLHKNIQLMLEFLKGPFLVLHFSYCTLMTILMRLSVILLSVLMIILSTLNVIKHLSPEVTLSLYKSAIQPCMEYCCDVWAGAPSCYLELLDKLQKRICRTVDPSLLPLLNPWLIIKI